MTDRALKLLQKVERKTSIRDENKIKAILERNNVSYSEAIIEFQVRYGGLVFHAGLEPICWGIHHVTPRGEFKYMGKEIVPFEDEGEFPEFSLLCADTLYQMRWTIDKNGAIFEDFDILTNSFDKMIEDYAMWDEFKVHKDKEVWKRNIYGKDLNLILSRFNKVEPLEEIQEPGIRWFKVDNNYYLTERNKEIVVFGPTHIETNQRGSILALVS